MTAYVSALLFAGYLLVYAAIANHGKFVLRPWDSLRKSAYPDDVAGSPRQTPYADEQLTGGGIGDALIAGVTPAIKRPR